MMYVYMRTKAVQYLRVGPAIYRRQDYFHMPPGTWDQPILDLVAGGFRQIVEWRGLSEEDPFTGLGIDGFYAMMDVLHFELESQALVSMKPRGHILDQMVMRHRMDPSLIVLYNMVVALQVEQRASPALVARRATS